MKKITLLIVAIFGIQFLAFAQISEPMISSNMNVSIQNNVENSNALFDLLFINDIGLQGSTNDGSLTGILFFNNQYWISRWNMNTIHAVDIDNNLIETFSIPGITGARTFTTDGINIYVATAEDKIYVVDHATKTLINTIQVTSSALVRMLTYDETLDNGNGGFWIAGYENGLIASVDMNGNELVVFDLNTHGTRPYDGVVDHVSDGGPYLWVHEFGLTGLDDYITQIDLATGTQTGVRYNFALDSPGGTSNIQAGGLFLTDEIDPNGGLAFLGVCQCFPSNLLFAIKLEEPTFGIEDLDMLNFVLYPNPASDKINIDTGVSEEKKIFVFDLLGKEVMYVVTTENELNITSLISGIYLVQITQGNSMITKKLVVD